MPYEYNGKNARFLMKQGYLLRDGDEVTLVPVVAGGWANVTKASVRSKGN